MTDKNGREIKERQRVRVDFEGEVTSLESLRSTDQYVPVARRDGFCSWVKSSEIEVISPEPGETAWRAYAEALGGLAYRWETCSEGFKKPWAAIEAALGYGPGEAR